MLVSVDKENEDDFYTFSIFIDEYRNFQSFLKFRILVGLLGPSIHLLNFICRS